MFVRVIPEPVIDEILFLIFLPIILSLVSTRRLLFISLGSIFFNPLSYEFAIEFFIAFAIYLISLISIGGPNVSVASNRNPPTYIILDS